MNWVDIVILIILVIGLGRGLANGFVKGLFGLAALVLGIIVAAGNYQQVAEVLTSRLAVGEQLQMILAFLIVFVIVLVLVSIVGRLIAKALKLASLGWIDRLAGGVLGVFMSCLFVGVLLLVAVMAGLHENRGIARSTVAPTVISVMDTVVAFAPEGARERIEEHYLKLRVEWERARRQMEREEEEGEGEGENVALLERGELLVPPPTTLPVPEEQRIGA